MLGFIAMLGATAFLLFVLWLGDNGYGQVAAIGMLIVMAYGIIEHFVLKAKGRK